MDYDTEYGLVFLILLLFFIGFFAFNSLNNKVDNIYDCISTNEKNYCIKEE